MNFGNLINPHKSVLHSKGDIRPTRKWCITYFTSLLRGQIETAVCTFYSLLKWIFAPRNSRWNYFPLKILILTFSLIDLFCQEILVALGPKRSQFFFVCIASMGVKNWKIFYHKFKKFQISSALNFFFQINSARALILVRSCRYFINPNPIVLIFILKHPYAKRR